jgi:hypothetical protein
MSPSVHATLYQVHGHELAELLDLLLAGEVVTDRTTAERLIRTVGALLRLHGWHQPDNHGHCGLCWTPPRHPWRPWPTRSACTVHNALGSYFPRPTRQTATPPSTAGPS